MSTGYAWHGFGDRIADAIEELQEQYVRKGRPRPTYEQIGVEIARIEGRDKPYTGPALTAWIQERNEPTLAAFCAMAIVLRQRDPSWLAFALPKGRAQTRPFAFAVEELPDYQVLVPKALPAYTPKRRRNGKRRKRGGG